MKEKTAEQILHKYFHHFKSERTRNLIVKAMEEYRLQSHPSPVMSTEQYSSGAIHTLGEFQVEELDKCRYNNEQLIEKVQSIVRDLAMSGGKSWSLQVPVNFDKDPDVLISELCNRFKRLLSTTPSVKADGCEHDCVAKDMYWKQCHKCGMILPIN